MSLISLADRAPVAFDTDQAREVLDRFAGQPENLRALLRGTAGCSPYLRGLMLREADWLESVLGSDPADVMAALRAPITDAPNPATTLRLRKRRLALYTALADCGGVWGLDEVTGALTEFADFAVSAALTAQITPEITRGRLPGCGEGDIATACGLSVLAMGKLGAHELNYSSDIDLIVLFDESRFDEADFETARSRFIRVTRQMARMLSEVSAEGYVFRTDLRLRPDPSVTPVCLSMGAAERYYESLGRSWERAAYIKARPCAGDIEAGARFLKTLEPFVWRKHLDFAAIEDAHDMRLRIRSHKGLAGPITVEGHDMKLGRGGIREIEFFTQTRQIIAGGRDPDLRSRRTEAALAALADKGWIGAEVAEALCAAYREHRRTEHRIQMIGDAQSHRIPAGDENFARLAAFCGFDDPARFRAETKARLEMVHELTEGFFAPGSEGAGADLSPERQEQIERWQALPALRSPRAGSIFRRLLPAILTRIDETIDPESTLTQFERFLSGLPAGVQLFSLFEANPQLLDLLLDICGAAPSLAQYLSRNAAVFDAVIGGTFFEPVPGVTELTAALDHRLAEVPDYEDQLNAARRWMKEQHFRIGVQHLKGMIDGAGAARHYSDLAESCLRALLGPVVAEFSRRHGPMPGRGAMVLGMGSLGAQSLTATSDLDLIVIYDAMGQEHSTGKRPLAVSAYFARLTQALVTALSSPMAEGRLYEVDMRLRPSGRQGPVATALSAFTAYQENEAWTWEHMALTRARPVAGTPSLCNEVEEFRRQIVARPRDAALTLGDVRDMRRRIRDATPREALGNVWETKQGPGRMLEIELLAQAAALLAGLPVRRVERQLPAAAGRGWLSEGEVEALQAAYRRLSRLRQIARLIVAGPLRPEALGPAARALLLAETDTDSVDSLARRLERESAASAALIDRVIGDAPG